MVLKDTEKLKSKTTYRAKFTETQIDTLSGIKPDTKRRRITPEEAFSIWVLSHLLAGIRFTDLMMLRYRNFHLDEADNPVQLSYTMSKTGNVVNLPLFDEAQDLLKRWWKAGAQPDSYLLPYLRMNEPYSRYNTREELQKASFEVRRMLDTRLHYWNDKINTVLALIQKEAKLKDNLRMHNARHSFADLARRIMQEDNSITLLDITLMLGQRDPKMVMHYIEGMENQDASKPMGAVFNRKKKEGIAN
ncbi:MAG: hypothetical protein EOO88_25290 [Pedobacter sp.]|nr:MAG: hypothetical protein EOO88_25290 [Pedobacter sp.]